MTVPAGSWTSLAFALAMLAAGPAAARAQCPGGLDALAWMAGEWVGGDGDVAMTEVWLPPAGGVMPGLHRDVFGRGRSFFEFLRVAPGEDGIPVYHASQGGRPATPFRAVECADGRAVFDNPDHDYPRRIVYERDGPTLTARIEGVEAGEEKSSEWRYVARGEAEREALLGLQAVERRAHLEKDAELLVSLFADDFASVAAGRVTRPSRAEHLQRFAGYLESVDFLEWDDVEPPVIRISGDGSMAWVLVRKRVRVVPAGEPDAEPATTLFAWTETWEKRGGEWKLTSVTSTERSGEEADVDR